MRSKIVKNLLPFLSIVIGLLVANIIQSNTIIKTPSIEQNVKTIPHGFDEFATEVYAIPELPDEDLPAWEINITGIGITTYIPLQLSDLIEDVNNSILKAYEETITYKDASQTIIGIDILDLIQKYAGVWYGGNIDFIAEDDYSVQLPATQIMYSYYPPVAESADIKILLAFAVNGSYLENSDWNDKGGLQLVCPSNLEFTYTNNFWNSNITEISIVDRWICDIIVDDILETSVPVTSEMYYTEYDYLKYNLTVDSESTQFEGPSLLSILEYIEVDVDSIQEILVSAPDYTTPIDVSEISGEYPTILATKINGETYGYNKGPFRLVGGNLPSFHWMKNLYKISISTNATVNTPSYGFICTLTVLFGIAFSSIIRKRN
ncbi:MAG: molybdopterin-dependent oxidoreductase [Candidatus Thorarchaeota archaeon]